MNHGNNGAPTIVGGIVLKAFAEYGLAAETIYADTTSVSIYGDYASQDEDAPLVLAKGHSKDHRPDLKQFKYGLAVNGDGILIFGETIARLCEFDMSFYITSLVEKT